MSKKKTKSKLFLNIDWKKFRKKIPMYKNQNLAYFALTLFVLSICAFSIKTYLTPSYQRVEVLAAKNTYQEEVDYWTDLALKHPDYIDAWVALARLDYEGGNYEKAIVWINKARSIDPNSDKIKALLTELNLE